MTWEAPSTLSPSKLTLFTQCPLKFRFQHIQKVYGGPTFATFVGNTGHSALERFMDRPPVERDAFTLDVDIEEVLAEAKTSDDYQILLAEQDDGDVLKDFDATVRRVTRRFLDMVEPAEVKVVSTEQRLEVPFEDTTLVGIIDLLVDDDGLEVWDHKTGRAPGERYQRKSMDGINFYAVMVKRHLGEVPRSIRLLYLNERLTISVDPTERTIRATEDKIRAVLAAIDRAAERDDFRANPSKLCDWCDFKAYCPAHGGDPDDLPVPVVVSS